MRWLTDLLIRIARRTPYFHLRHADGSLYMERFWLVRPGRWLPFAVRLHQIRTADYDRHFHDHPWNFVSVVLRGYYIERRPDEIDPCFGRYGDSDVELQHSVHRNQYSIAYRRCTDRHLIVWVAPGTWTLVITSRKRHWWGFYTPAGKVHWRDYESVHNCTAAGEGG